MEARHVTLDEGFITQFGSASSTRRVIELAVVNIFGQATIFHTVDVAQPAQISLPYDSSEVISAGESQDGGVGDMIRP